MRTTGLDRAQALPCDSAGSPRGVDTRLPSLDSPHRLPSLRVAAETQNGLLAGPLLTGTAQPARAYPQPQTS